MNNKVTGLVVTIRIEMDKRSVEGGETLSLGACIQSLTSEGWRLTHILEADDGALTAVLWRGWDIGVRPPPPPTQGMSPDDASPSTGKATP